MHGLGAALTAARDMRGVVQVYDLTKLLYSLEAAASLIVNSEGEVLSKSPLPQALSSWDAIYYRLRANFDGFRSDYCEPPPAYPGDGKSMYMGGYAVTNLGHENSLVAVQYQNAKGEP